MFLFRNIKIDTILITAIPHSEKIKASPIPLTPQYREKHKAIQTKINIPKNSKLARHQGLLNVIKTLPLANLKAKPGRATAKNCNISTMPVYFTPNSHSITGAANHKKPTKINPYINTKIKIHVSNC